MLKLTDATKSISQCTFSTVPQTVLTDSYDLLKWEFKLSHYEFTCMKTDFAYKFT